jgi:presenilin-like A22 family membrane protease
MFSLLPNFSNQFFITWKASAYVIAGVGEKKIPTVLVKNIILKNINGLRIIVTVILPALAGTLVPE